MKFVRIKFILILIHILIDIRSSEINKKLNNKRHNQECNIRLLNFNVVNFLNTLYLKVSTYSLTNSGINKLSFSNQCYKSINNFYNYNLEKINNLKIEQSLKNHLNKLSQISENLGITFEQKEYIKRKLIENDPKGLCIAYQKAISNQKQMHHNMKDITKIKIEILSNLISRRYKKKNEIRNELLCLYCHNKSSRQELWEMFKDLNYNEIENFIYELRNMLIESMASNYNSIDIAEEKIDCSHYPHKFEFNNCMKVSFIVYIQAAWLTFKNFKNDSYLSTCLEGIYSRNFLNLFNSHIYNIDSIINVIGSFKINTLNEIKYLSEMNYYAFKAINSEEIEERSIYLGNAAGIVIKIINDKKK